MDAWSGAEWLTLQLGPVWVASAMIGRGHLDEFEAEAFWQAVDDVADATPAGRQLLYTMLHHREWLLDEFALDDRSIVTGLDDVASLLERVAPQTRDDLRQAILEVGSGFARARGPFGRRINDQDAVTLQLAAQLLETAGETAEANPLNAADAI